MAKDKIGRRFLFADLVRDVLALTELMQLVCAISAISEPSFIPVSLY